MNNDVAVIDTADVAARVKNYKEHLLQLGLSWRQFAKKLFGLTEEQLSVLLYSSPIRTWEQLTSPEQKIYGRMDSWMKKMAKKEQDATLGPLCFCRQQLDELMVTCMSNEKCVGYTWYHQECLIGRAIGVIDDDFLCPVCVKVQDQTLVLNEETNSPAATSRPQPVLPAPPDGDVYSVEMVNRTGANIEFSLITESHRVTGDVSTFSH